MPHRDEFEPAPADHAQTLPDDPKQPAPAFRPARFRMRSTLSGGRPVGTRFFDSAEHWSIVDGMRLPMADGSLADAVTHPFALDNGLKLMFGQIIALAGDFYAHPHAPISDQQDKERAFVEAFDTLDKNRNTRETTDILAIMEKEFVAIANAINAGEPPHEAYAREQERWDTAYNIATGGGKHYLTLISDWGRYLWIAAYNWDHFGEHARQVYRAGLEVAMRHAAAASRLSGAERDRGLQRAYALLAFACHYLTDAFSAGHIRTPRRHLHAFPSPPLTTASFLADLCSLAMHAEDSYNGLWVRNAAGDRWIAYGDGRYFDDANAANRNVIRAAVRAAIRDVHEAFLHGRPLASPISPTLMPQAPDRGDQSNFSPMFAVDGGGNVLVRDNLFDPKRHHWETLVWPWLVIAPLAKRASGSTQIGGPPGSGTASGPNVGSRNSVSAWLPPKVVEASPGVALTADATPALAVFHGHLWACVRQGDQLLAGLHDGARSWFQPVSVPGLTIRAATGACLVAHDVLHCFYAEPDGAVRWLQFDGAAWSNQGVVLVDGATIRTDAAPTAVWLPRSQSLLLIYKGYGVASLYFAFRIQRLSQWTGNLPIFVQKDYEAMTDGQPFAVLAPGRAFVYFRAHGGDTIYWIRIDDESGSADFYGNLPVTRGDGTQVGTSGGVAAATQHGDGSVLMVFQDSGGDGLQSLTQTRLHGTDTPRFEQAAVLSADGVRLRSARTPALLAFEGDFRLWTVQPDTGRVLESIAIPD